MEFGLLPINKKAEISHSFFSIHLRRTRQLTSGEIVVKSVLSRILPKFSSKEEKCESEIFFKNRWMQTSYKAVVLNFENDFPY